MPLSPDREKIVRHDIRNAFVHEDDLKDCLEDAVSYFFSEGEQPVAELWLLITEVAQTVGFDLSTMQEKIEKIIEAGQAAQRVRDEVASEGLSVFQIFVEDYRDKMRSEHTHPRAIQLINDPAFVDLLLSAVETGSESAPDSTTKSV